MGFHVGDLIANLDQDIIFLKREVFNESSVSATELWDKGITFFLIIK